MGAARGDEAERTCGGVTTRVGALLPPVGLEEAPPPAGFWGEGLFDHVVPERIADTGWIHGYRPSVELVCLLSCVYAVYSFHPAARAFELRALSFVVLSVVAMCVNIVPKAYVRNRMRPPGGPVERRPPHGVAPPIRAPTTRAYRTIYSARPDVKL